jgi:hypothetical protein
LAWLKPTLQHFQFCRVGLSLGIIIISILSVSSFLPSLNFLARLANVFYGTIKSVYTVNKSACICFNSSPSCSKYVQSLIFSASVTFEQEVTSYVDDVISRQRPDDNIIYDANTVTLVLYFVLL